jgi:protein-L-isoaspartate(D-aspartate) O-methyltransferase
MEDSNKEVLIKSLIEKGFSFKIVEAFRKVPREKSVLKRFKSVSYEDIALPIGFEQTISQPYTIAFMLDLLNLRDNQKILEVGSGSGYVLCLISEISKNSEVFGVERIEEFVVRSNELLKSLDKENVKVFNADKEIGLKRYAPFDRLLVSAFAKEIPKELISQLNVRGIMVIPIKNSIFKIIKTEKGFDSKEFPGFSFVPLI